MNWKQLALLAGVIAAGGCTSIPKGSEIIPPEVPIELNKITLPEHMIEAPDILQITAINAIPRRPYRLQVSDMVSVSVPDNQVLAGNPLAGLFVIDPEGFLDLGPIYKRVQIGGLTVEEAQQAVRAHLMSKDVGLKMPEVTISLARARAIQQIAGEHLVRADGTIYLGTYGSVLVSGLTLSRARQRIEDHLAAYLHEPQIALDVLAYNSKVIYVIFDSAGMGQQVYRLPVTGNETVLDAIGQVNGLGPVSNKQHIWVARPAPKDCIDQVLPVDWCAITTRGKTATNYQLLPGDRVYVQAYKLSTLDVAMARAIAPLERVFGIVLLGTSTANQIATFGQIGVGGAP